MGGYPWGGWIAVQAFLFVGVVLGVIGAVVLGLMLMAIGLNHVLNWIAPA